MSSLALALLQTTGGVLHTVSIHAWKRHTRWKLVQRLLLIGCLGSLAIAFYADRRSEELPPVEQLLPQLQHEPRQEAVTEDPFVLSYGNSQYTIAPKASYELYGLVVTHNDILSFDDIYHDENSVDIKDICVVWGNNLKDSIYREMKYWSEPWTCFVQATSRVSERNFDGTALSNNHLLAENPIVQDAIRSARIGDQIYLKGQLVDYQQRGEGAFWRRTSVTREDDGDGACEVVFVEQFSVLKRANLEWRLRYKRFVLLAQILCGLSVAAFFYRTYRQ